MCVRVRAHIFRAIVVEHAPLYLPALRRVHTAVISNFSWLATSCSSQTKLPERAADRVASKAKSKESEEQSEQQEQEEEHEQREQWAAQRE